ncbi:LPXTG cell wall anchor domain-containing protein [Streptomyces sp. NPDC050856]|uniref:LPXTG cell wall anchor domain-containing protein n=1 Tax=Streptomyces sp. NPDC050856 TaxID=3154939 RepID=UPI00340B5CD4
MKLRRAMAVAAATAVIAPAAFLAAPAAYATDGTTSTTSTSGATGETESATPDGTTTDDAPKTDDGTATTEDGTATEDGSKTGDGAATEDGTKTEDEPKTDDGSKTEDDTTTGGAEDGAEKPGTETGKDEGKGEGEVGSKPGDDEWSPYDCSEFNLDENLKVNLTGLPSKIVAGSGWHDFEFSVTNGSDADLKKVYVETFTDYDSADETLNDGLAEVQYKDPETGEWTDSYQDSYQDEEGNFVYTGSFVGMIDKIEKGATVDMDLRVRVDAKAPAGSSFAFSSAIYAGEGTACYGNGDEYVFTVLAAGSNAGDVDEAKPSGEKPDGKKPGDAKPQGGAKPLPVTGNLAETGSNSMLPTIGIAGGIAIVAGAGVVFALKRRNSGATA